jgi:Ca2+-binding RTX toxin-like protein
MSDQVVGNDGRADTIRVQRNGSNLELIVNGQVYYSDLASNIRSLKIDGSGDDDYFDLAAQHAITVYGGAGIDNDTLIGPNQINNWTIAGDGSGYIGSWADFYGIDDIKGNANSDIFAFRDGARVPGAINGGNGADVLDFSRYTTTVDVNLLEWRATGAGSVIGVEDVKGGSGNDILVGNRSGNRLVGNGGHDILDGGDGADFLFGGSGHDLLIGGLGPDQLDGQGDDDILIGGRLTVSSRWIRSEWIRTDNSYNSRVANLRTGTGINGSARLISAGGRVTETSATVLDDGVTDQLTGGAGQDWFWAAPGEVSDRQFDLTHGRFELIN